MVGPAMPQSCHFCLWALQAGTRWGTRLSRRSPSCPKPHLEVGGLGLRDGLVKFVSGGDLACQVLIDAGQFLSQLPHLILQPLLLILFLLDLPAQLLPLQAQLLNA